MPKLPPSRRPQNQSDLWRSGQAAGLTPARHPPGDGPRLTRPPEVRTARPRAPTRGLGVISLRFIMGKSPVSRPKTRRTTADMPAKVGDGGTTDRQIRKKASISQSNDVKNRLNMPKHDSLDDLISTKAAEYADQIKAAAAMAANEEEIRIEAERQLAFIEKAADVKLEGRHEFTVASGRIDSVYFRVIIEYKNPKSPGDRIGPKADSPGSKKVVDQIKKRFYDMRTQHGQPLNSLFGVGLDGNHFIFVRFRDEKWQVQEPLEVNRHSAERFLWALFNLGNKGKPFSRNISRATSARKAATASPLKASTPFTMQS